MKKIAPKLFLSLVSLLAVFFVLEVAARRLKGVPLTYCANFVETRVNLMKSVFPTRYDARLGWVPAPGDYTDSNYWGKPLRILEDGIRSNGAAAARDPETVILAVGDSFTFGSQVGDAETWPAVLERESGVSVVNGGVFAYGIDQAVLRAEELIPLVHPRVVVLSFIPDNVNRAERAMRTGVAKPYFDIVDGRLELRNTPVPPRPAEKRIGLFRRVAGYSLLADAVMKRAMGEERWYLGDWESVRAHSRGAEVACLLMARLARLERQHGVRVVVMAQYTDELYGDRQPESIAVLRCAREQALVALDLYDPLRDIARHDAARFRSFFRGHMTAAGNAFVAGELRRLLENEGMIAAARPAAAAGEGRP